MSRRRLVRARSVFGVTSQVSDQQKQTHAHTHTRAWPCFLCACRVFDTPRLGPLSMSQTKRTAMRQCRLRPPVHTHACTHQMNEASICVRVCVCMFVLLLHNRFGRRRRRRRPFCARHDPHAQHSNRRSHIRTHTHTLTQPANISHSTCARDVRARVVYVYSHVCVCVCAGAIVRPMTTTTTLRRR